MKLDPKSLKRLEKREDYKPSKSFDSDDMNSPDMELSESSEVDILSNDVNYKKSEVFTKDGNLDSSFKNLEKVFQGFLEISRIEDRSETIQMYDNFLRLNKAEIEIAVGIYSDLNKETKALISGLLIKLNKSLEGIKDEKEVEWDIINDICNKIKSQNGNAEDLIVKTNIKDSVESLNQLDGVLNWLEANFFDLDDIDEDFEKSSITDKMQALTNRINNKFDKFYSLASYLDAGRDNRLTWDSIQIFKAYDILFVQKNPTDEELIQATDLIQTFLSPNIREKLEVVPNNKIKDTLKKEFIKMMNDEEAAQNIAPLHRVLIRKKLLNDEYKEKRRHALIALIVIIMVITLVIVLVALFINSYYSDKTIIKDSNTPIPGNTSPTIQNVISPQGTIKKSAGIIPLSAVTGSPSALTTIAPTPITKTVTTVIDNSGKRALGMGVTGGIGGLLMGGAGVGYLMAKRRIDKEYKKPDKNKKHIQFYAPAWIAKKLQYGDYENVLSMVTKLPKGNQAALLRLLKIIDSFSLDTTTNVMNILHDRFVRNEIGEYLTPALLENLHNALLFPKDLSMTATLNIFLSNPQELENTMSISELHDKIGELSQGGYDESVHDTEIKGKSMLHKLDSLLAAGYKIKYNNKTLPNNEIAFFVTNDSILDLENAKVYVKYNGEDIVLDVVDEKLEISMMNNDSLSRMSQVSADRKKSDALIINPSLGKMIEA